jgi:hypothetical protein
MKIPFQDAKIKISRGSTTCVVTQRGYMEKSAQALVTSTTLFHVNTLLKNVNLLV